MADPKNIAYRMMNFLGIAQAHKSMSLEEMLKHIEEHIKEAAPRWGRGLVEIEQAIDRMTVLMQTSHAPNIRGDYQGVPLHEVVVELEEAIQYERSVLARGEENIGLELEECRKERDVLQDTIIKALRR